MQLLLQLRFIELLNRQAGEYLDAVFQFAVCGAKSVDLGGFIPAFSGGVCNAPMRSHRLPRPDGTYFTGGVIANGKYKVHYRRTGLRELAPVLAARLFHGDAHTLQNIQGIGINPACRHASRAKSPEFAAPPMIYQGFG